jgi:ankyrin repeat protein
LFSEIAKIIMEKRPEMAREATTGSCTPLRHVVLYGKIDMLRVMLEHDSTLGYEIDNQGIPLLNAAAFRGQVAAAQELLKHCPDAPPYNKEDGDTLLHQAVQNDQEEFVEFVLKTPLLRKVVNMQNNNGTTALHNAVQNCNPRIVVDLLSHEDIDVTILDKLGSPAAWQLWGFIENAKTLNWVRTHATDSIDHA